MSVDVITVTEEVFGIPLTRAGAERAVREAAAVEKLKKHSRFQTLVAGWRQHARARAATLSTAKVETLRAQQMSVRMAHVLDDILADIAVAGVRAETFIGNDDKATPFEYMPSQLLTRDDLQALVKEGREVEAMLGEPGWAVVMQRVAEGIRVHCLALEVCSVDEMAYHQMAIQNMQQPIRLMHEAVRLGRVTEAWLERTHGERREGG